MGKQIGAKGATNEGVGGVDFAFEVNGHHDNSEENAANGVAEDDLYEAKVAAFSKEHGGYTDKSEGTGLGGDDREGNAPPWEVAAAQEVVARGFLAAPKPQAEGDDAGEVEGDDGPVGGGEAGGGEHEALSRAEGLGQLNPIHRFFSLHIG